MSKSEKTKKEQLVEKYGNDTFIHKQRVYECAFTTIPNETLESLPHDALGVWVYMIHKPSNWRIRRTEIAKHFNISVFCVEAILKKLEKAGLLTRKRLRTSGKFGEMRYDIYDICQSNKTTKMQKFNVGETNVDDANVGETNVDDANVDEFTSTKERETQRKENTKKKEKQTKEKHQGPPIVPLKVDECAVGHFSFGEDIENSDKAHDEDRFDYSKPSHVERCDKPQTSNGEDIDDEHIDRKSSQFTIAGAGLSQTKSNNGSGAGISTSRKAQSRKSEQNLAKSQQIDSVVDPDVDTSFDTNDVAVAVTVQSDAISVKDIKVPRRHTITEKQLQILYECALNDNVNFMEDYFKDFWRASYRLCRKLNFYKNEDTEEYWSGKDLSETGVWRSALFIAHFLLRNIHRHNKKAFKYQDQCLTCCEWAIWIHPYLQAEDKEGYDFRTMLRAIVYVFDTESYEEGACFTWDAIVTDARIFVRNLEKIMGKYCKRYDEVKKEREYDKYYAELEKDRKIQKEKEEEENKKTRKQKLYKTREAQLQHRPSQLSVANAYRSPTKLLTERMYWASEDAEWEKIAADIEYWSSSEDLFASAMSRFVQYSIV